MMDIYRRPDKLLAAMEKITPAILQGAIANAKRSNVKRVFIPLHWGADNFMSDDQFKTFYWPGLQKILLGLIEEGLTPCPFFEGEYTARLKYLTELPKGKVLAWFDRVDMVKAKDMLKDIACIGGNMPTSVLQFVREYTRNLIETAGEGGGFIMAARSVLDEADPKMVKVWAEATREYGIY
jgi:uroporphyrinogen-III decarboxylase